MATITYHNVGITAMAACVPSKIAYNKDLGYLIPEEEIEKIINNIGIKERRIADVDVCASDLCYKAALKLFEDNDIDPNSIDMVLFMSQTADYRIPATAPILQSRLGLPKTTACMDLSLGCSGYVYALSTAFAYASMDGINRVLLLDGETFSKIVNENDKVNLPLYGDAGTATLIEKGEFKTSTFILNSDGTGKDSVKIHAGMRNQISEASLQQKVQEEGNIRSELDLYMDGMDVFNFAISSVPKSIKEISKKVEKELSEIDYLIFHQSNKFMTDFFIKKLKFDSTKAPYCIQKFGNTSSASVPLTIVSELKDQLNEDKSLIMCGFGAGLSWATAYLTMKNCNISELINY